MYRQELRHLAYQEKPLEILETIHRRTVTSEIVTGFRLPCFVRFYFTANNKTNGFSSMRKDDSHDRQIHRRSRLAAR